MRCDSGMIRDTKFVLMKMLDELLPDDDEFEDTGCHKLIREEAEGLQTWNKSPPITIAEIEKNK